MCILRGVFVCVCMYVCGTYLFVCVHGVYMYVFICVWYMCMYVGVCVRARVHTDWGIRRRTSYVRGYPSNTGAMKQPLQTHGSSVN